MPDGDIETYYEDGKWKNRVEGGQRASSTYETKADAQTDGRRMAKDREVEHIIRNKDGEIGQRNTYTGHDPRTTKG
jgi:hypothetical protein